MRKLLSAAAVLLLISFATLSYADVVTLYTSRAAYEAAIGASQTFDFNQPEGTVVNTLGGALSVSTVGADANGLVHDSALCGSSGGAVDCFPPVLFTYTQPLNAFGYDNLDFNGFEEAVVTLSFTSGDPSQSFVFDLGGLPAFTPIFFGAVSSGNIASVQIYSRDPGSDTIGERANVIDNVEIPLEPVQTPEPASLLLLGTGLAAIACTLRRRSP